MNLILIITLLSDLNLYFIKDSPDLLVKVQPQSEVEQITLYYSFLGPAWDSVIVTGEYDQWSTKIKSPEGVEVVGFYFTYPDGTIDDNNGALYLYEIKLFPRSLMPFSCNDLEMMINQAQKKINAGTHLDEALILLEYVDHILGIVPVIKNSSSELQRNILKVKVEKLKELIAK